jgi:hypothetical protein
MILQPIDFVVDAWLIIAVLSAVYVGYDQFSKNPEAPVMKWGFVLVTLYMGPIGLLLYVMADKEPSPGTHERFVQPLWKQGVGSTVHCVAGDATGIILAAAVTALLGFPMWVDVIVDARDHGRQLPEQCAPKLHARIVVDEHDDGRHGSGHDSSHDGSRHAGNVAW